MSPFTSLVLCRRIERPANRGNTGLSNRLESGVADLGGLSSFALIEAPRGGEVVGAAERVTRRVVVGDSRSAVRG